MQEALRGRINTALGSVVANWGLRPQGGALPAVTLTIITETPFVHYKGEQSLRETLVQADCWAKTHSVAMTLAEAVIAAVLPAATQTGIRFSRSFVDRRSDRGETTELGFVHRHQIDLRIWWRPA